MLPAASGVFFASGFAALLYQVVWQRLLAIFSGADVHSATIVVAAFMAGLGCGSFGGGHIADRVTRRTSLMLFVAAELAVAAFGLASSSFFYGFLYQHLGPLGLGLSTTCAVLFVSLLWPTFFMGASLPLLTRALARDVSGAPATVGWLYACNTLGAAAGALVGTWSLLPGSGLSGTVRMAASINVGCALLALALGGAGRSRLRDHISAPADVSRSSRLDAGPAFWTYTELYALSGFLALSFEIVWCRLLGVMLKSTSLTFGTLLTIYLLGLGVGAGLGSAVASRVRRARLAFVCLQVGAAAYAVLSLTFVIARSQG